MKAKYENAVYCIEPETSDEDHELKSLIARFSARGVTEADSAQATGSRPSDLARSTVDSAL